MSKTVLREDQAPGSMYSGLQNTITQTLNLPDIFKHVEHLRGEVGIGHIKFSEVCLQH